MTGAHDRQRFGAAVHRLYAAWGKRPDDQMISAWWDGLEDYALASVLDGLLEAQKSAGRYAPNFGEVRAQVAKVDRVPRISPEMHEAIAEGEMFCAECEDTTWRYQDEPHPLAGQRNGLATMRADATRVRCVRCTCWPGNPVFQRNRPRPFAKEGAR